MICLFHFKGAEIFVSAHSIVGIMPPLKGAGAAVYCEAPLGLIIVDDSVQEAFSSWYVALNEIEQEAEPEDTLPAANDKIYEIHNKEEE